MHDMSNEQLIAYIKQRLAAQVSREQVANELVAAGWQQEDIHAAFNAVAVPAAESTPAPPPYMPGINLGETFLMKEAMRAGAGSGGGRAFDLSRGIDLVIAGVSMYRKRLAVLLPLGAIQLIPALLVWFAQRWPAFGGIAVLGGLLVLAVGALLWAFTLAAMMFVIRDGSETVRFGTALSGGVHLLLPYSWVALLQMFATLGIVGLIAYLPRFGLHVLAGHSGLGGVIGGLSYVYFIVAVLAAVFVATTLFLFSTWALVADNRHGTHALATSFQVVLPRFSTMFWTVFGAFLALGAVQYVVTNVAAVGAALFSPLLGVLVGGLLNSLVFIPVSLAMVFVLYGRVRGGELGTATVLSQTSGVLSTVVLGLAVAGVVTLTVIVDPALLLSPMNPSQTSSSQMTTTQFVKVRDIQQDVQTLHEAFTLYDVLYGTYPTSPKNFANLSTQGQRSLVDLGHVAGTYSYTVATSSLAYTLCAPMGNGTKYCADSGSMRPYTVDGRGHKTYGALFSVSRGDAPTSAAQKQVNDEIARQSVDDIKSSLVLYHEQKGTYPRHLAVLAKNPQGTVMSDVTFLVHTYYSLTYQSDGSHYKLCTTLSDRSQYCQTDKGVQRTRAPSGPAIVPGRGL